MECIILILIQLCLFISQPGNINDDSDDNDSVAIYMIDKTLMESLRLMSCKLFFLSFNLLQDLCNRLAKDTKPSF